MTRNLQQIINTSENEIKQMKAEEIENLLNELKPFIIDYHKEDWNHPKELWSKVEPEEDNNMAIGTLNPPFVNFCQRIFERVISLAQSVKSEKEIEFPIIERLLARLSTAYASRVLDEEIAKEHFFPEKRNGNIRFQRKTALGQFLHFHILNKGEANEKLFNSKKRLQRIRNGQSETEQNTEHLESNSSSPSVQELAERRVKEAVEAANFALVRNSIESLERARNGLIEIQFEANNKELQNEFFKNKGQELLDKLDEKERQLKQDPPKTNDSSNTLQSAIDSAINEITTVLNQNQITENDLTVDYRNWRVLINGFNESAEVNNFKDKLIVSIRAKGEYKQKSSKINDDIETAQGKSGTELLNDLKNIKKDEGDKSYEENREKVRQLEQKAAQEDPEGYRKNAVDTIKVNMNKNEVKEEDFSPELKEVWIKLTKEEINEPDQLIIAEEKITQGVGELGAKKRLDKIIDEANQFFKTGNKKDLEQVKEKLIKFISSTNVYEQALYSQRESATKEMLAKLENCTRNKTAQPSKSNFFRPELFIPLVLLVVVLVAAAVALAKRRKNSKNT